MQARNISSWRKKPPPSIALLLQDLHKVRFFVLEKIGPTNFVLSDGNEKNYRVGIGNQVSCSCDPLKIDHCIHSLFCMVKVLKVNPDEPIVWQAEYSDYELSDIVQGKYSKARRKRKSSIGKTVFQLELEEQTQYCIRGEEDCPICQDRLSSEDGLTICPEQCKSTFHLACALVWVRHRKSAAQDINCPICRSTWTRTKLKELQKQQQQQTMKTKLNTFICKYCACNIPDHAVYLCPLCQQLFVCQACKKQHHRVHQHSSLILRSGKSQPLKGENGTTLFQALLPYFHVMVPNDKKKISRQEPSCSVCLRSKFVQLRRMPCGHFIDEGCLKGKLELSDFICSADRTPYLLGLHSLEQRKSQGASFNDHIRQIKSYQEVEVYQKVLSQLQTERKKSSSRQKRRPSCEVKANDMKGKLDFIKQAERQNAIRRAYHDSLQKMLQKAQQQGKKILEQQRCKGKRPSNNRPPLPPQQKSYIEKQAE